MQRTPLMLAALFGDSDSLRLLLSTGADVRRADCDGRTVLHHGVGHSRVLDILLQVMPGSLVSKQTLRCLRGSIKAGQEV